MCLLSKVDHQVASLLGRPFSGWVQCDSEDADAPGGVLYHRQDIGLGAVEPPTTRNSPEIAVPSAASSPSGQSGMSCGRQPWLMICIGPDWAGPGLVRRVARDHVDHPVPVGRRFLPWKAAEHLPVDDHGM